MTAYNYIVVAIAAVNIFIALVVLPLRAQLKDAEKELRDLRNLVQTGYMSKSDFKDHLERIEKSLDDLKAIVLGAK